MHHARERLIFPLDVPDYDRAMRLVDLLAEEVGLFKVGLELFIGEGPGILKAITRKTDAGLFLDLKLHDIPTTVCRAYRAAAAYGPQFITIHCDEGGGVFQDLAADISAPPRLLAVTVLTSLNPGKLAALGLKTAYAADPARLALARARLALEAGCHGVVCSGHEVGRIKQAFGDTLITVTPGIRPAWTRVSRDDQARIVTPAQAIRSGADYLVVGRPIRDAPDPVDAARRVVEEIASAL